MRFLTGSQGGETRCESHRIPAMVHSVRQGKDTGQITSENRTSHGSELSICQCDFFRHERCCGKRRIDSAEHVREIILIWSVNSCGKKGATSSFAATWSVTMLNNFGLSDIIPLCHPEPLS